MKKNEVTGQEDGSSVHISVLTGLIPQFVPGWIVTLAMRMLSVAGGRLSVSDRTRHRTENEQRLLRRGDVLSFPHFIENQAELSDIIYGRNRKAAGSMAFSGCGVIAVWNAMMSLGMNRSGGDFLDMISEFERRYAVAGGKFGSVPSAAANIFKSRGYTPEVTYTRNRKKLDGLGKCHDVFIVTAFNDRRDIRKMLHTVCIEKKDEGFVIHNGYRREGSRWIKSMPYRTLSDAIWHIGADSVPVSTVCLSRRE